ncbi:MAG: hemolysin family protein [Dysgonamonadaceae bacterium]|jgi:CBS domain containing-hemolysin-like protein|nr:hemolysin family protein [Dysgonamonadaceae bacterium]
MTIQLLFTIFLVFLNGFFVAAEFAIVKVRNSQIEVEKNTSKAAMVAARNILSNLDGYLAATQLGITFASLGLGWVGEKIFTEIILLLFSTVGFEMSPSLASGLAIPVAFLLITIMHIVLGELAPKSLAIRKPVQITFGVALPLRIFYFVFQPFIWLLNGLANMLLRIVGIQPVHEQEDIHTEKELKVIIAESQKGGEIEETEKELIQNVFSLGDRKIQSLMTPRNEVVWINIEDDPETIKQTILEKRHDVYPLCRSNLDDVLGFIYTKDLVGEDFNVIVADLQKISREIQVVITTNKAYSVLERFQREKVYRAIVVDEYGSVKGIVTINDILDALVGDISETDEFEYASIEQADGSLIVDGQIPFIEFLEKVGLDDDAIDTTKAHYITIAGYIIDALERIPVEGDRVQWENFIFEVEVMDHNRVDKVKVTTV